MLMCMFSHNPPFHRTKNIFFSIRFKRFTVKILQVKKYYYSKWVFSPVCIILMDLIRHVSSQFAKETCHRSMRNLRPTHKIQRFDRFQRKRISCLESISLKKTIKEFCKKFRGKTAVIGSILPAVKSCPSS